MKIAMIGTGYVGLVSGACFSEFGFTVTCIDNDADKIARLKAGEIPIYEPGLDTIVRNNSAQGHLLFTTDLAAAVRAADVAFIAVGTPGRSGDGAADMAYVDAAAQDLIAELVHALVRDVEGVIDEVDFSDAEGQACFQLVAHPRRAHDPIAMAWRVAKGAAVGAAP